MEAYSCSSENLEKVPEGLLKKENINFPNVHFDLDQMIALSNGIRESKGDLFNYIPFCLTVEAESLGAIINLGDERVGPRAKECRYKDISELLNINYDVDFNSGRIKTVLDAISEISKHNYVILNVNGVFSILSSLVDSNILYRAMRKEKESVLEVLKNIEGLILRFTKEALERGCKVISYADPAGDIKIMGQKTFSEFSAPVTYEILKNTNDMLKNEILFLCGRMTNGLLKTGLIEVIPFEVKDIKNYGEGFLKVSKENHMSILGNYCIKRTHLNASEMKVYGIKLISHS